jgi:hypothetical protein
MMDSREGSDIMKMACLTAPEHWASYLINSDSSSLDASEVAQVDAWRARNNVVNVLDCGEHYFTWNLALYVPDASRAGGTVCDYQCEVR